MSFPWNRFAVRPRPSIQKIKKNSDAKIKANNKYKNKTYKRIDIDIRPEIADYIKQVADKKGLSLPQLIINAIKEYDNQNKEDL